VIYVRPKNIPAFCADLLEARLVERRPDHGRQSARERPPPANPKSKDKVATIKMNSEI
jgi:hypothetical protein